MTDFRMVTGFEDVWRPPVRLAVKRPEGRSAGSRPDPRARLARLAARVPEVMVKVTGRTRDPAHLKAHLTYITRNGELPAEDQDGLHIIGHREVVELAQDWAAVQLNDSRRRERSPFSVGIVLSMPQGTDALRLRDAAREFARSAFGERFDYLFALHTDAGHPHVHLTVRALGDHGERLNPKKADLEAWRQRFAQALRDRGIAAEATPRRARGVTCKAERIAIRKIRERAQSGRGLAGWVQRAAYHEAAGLAFGAARASPWDHRIAQRQRRVRALYLGQARLLQASNDPSDRALGRAVEDFVRGMPAPDTQRLELARELRAANAKLRGRPGDQERSDRRGRTR